MAPPVEARIRLALSAARLNIAGIMQTSPGALVPKQSAGVSYLIETEFSEQKRSPNLGLEVQRRVVPSGEHHQRRRPSIYRFADR